MEAPRVGVGVTVVEVRYTYRDHGRVVITDDRTDLHAIVLVLSSAADEFGAHLAGTESPAQ